MTSKLKCPFCGAELDKDISGEFGCPNEKCKKSMFLIGTEEMWRALIQAKQDLEIATKALEDITKEHSAFADWVFKAVTMKDIAEKALEQIEHKEQQQTERKAK